jgi:hypothetical protein
MVNIKTCKEKMAILGLKYPVTLQEEKKAALRLTREYNPDFCETSECKIAYESKISEIMKAHAFIKENYDLCNRSLDDHIKEVTFRVGGLLDPNDMTVKNVILNLEAEGYDLY